MITKLIREYCFGSLLFTLILFYSCPLAAQIYSTLSDPRDGHIYKTVKIGDQWWMAQNLDYRIDGSFYYLRDSTYASTYGRLYFYAAASKACPAGWHLPSDEEWTRLADFLGGQQVAATRMKKTDGGHWDYFSKSETNASGFSALPGGCHSSDWQFGMMRFLGFWWTSTAVDEISAWNRHLECGYGEVFRNTVKKTDGLSVRCIKD